MYLLNNLDTFLTECERGLTSICTALLNFRFIFHIKWDNVKDA